MYTTKQYYVYLDCISAVSSESHRYHSNFVRVAKSLYEVRSSYGNVFCVIHMIALMISISSIRTISMNTSTSYIRTNRTLMKQQDLRSSVEILSMDALVQKCLDIQLLDDITLSASSENNLLLQIKGSKVFLKSVDQTILKRRQLLSTRKPLLFSYMIFN